MKDRVLGLTDIVQMKIKMDRQRESMIGPGSKKKDNYM